MMAAVFEELDGFFALVEPAFQPAIASGESDEALLEGRLADLELMQSFLEHRRPARALGQLGQGREDGGKAFGRTRVMTRS